MTLAVLAGAVVLLLFLIARCKLNAFLALVLTSFAVGICDGMTPERTLQSILKGIGDTAGSLALILVFGAILGKLIEESGAAHSISRRFIHIVGKKRIQLAVMLTGLIVGMSMIYNASFLVLIPLIYALSVETGLPLLYLGIPLSASLSVAFGYLPPSPAPTAIATLYGADINRTLLYGLLLVLPATALAGPILSRFFRHSRNEPPATLYQPRVFSDRDLPGFWISLLSILLPVALMTASALVQAVSAHGSVAVAARFCGNPTVALFLAVLAGLYTLGKRRGRDMTSLMKSVTSGVASVSMVLMIITAGGAFKQVLLDAGTGDAIKIVATHMPVSPLVLAWCTAALIRMALGSATVAAITTGGIIVPLVHTSGVAPELLVLATTSGSLMFSHFNDIGFWMFKEYYNATIRQTFQVWTVMESIVAIVGLGGTLLLAQFVPAPPKHIIYVNSYHVGYPPSDEVAHALVSKLEAHGVSVDSIYLDAKRHPEEVQKRAADAVEIIRKQRPDLLIASDDDAVKYVVVPNFRFGPIPVVFAGINWDATKYALPHENVTGIIEIVPIEETLQVVREQFPRARRLLTLSEDSVSERSNTALLEPKYRALGFEPKTVMVSDFGSWKAAFAAGQTQSDVVYLPTNGTVRNWDRDEATAWVVTRARVPLITCDDFMMPYVALGFTKVAREQGDWAADAALAVLGGRKPSDIPITANHLSTCLFNPVVAARTGLRMPAGRGCRSAP